MKHATIDNFDDVYSVFRHHRTWFPHIRTDKLKRQIIEGSCIFQHGVVITYNIYKRRTRISNGSSLFGEKGDCILHQIATQNRDGSASKVFEEFFDFIDTNLYLSVRSTNHRAIGFYNKMGLKQVGKTSWSQGTMKGLIFNNRSDGSLEEFLPK